MLTIIPFLNRFINLILNPFVILLFTLGVTYLFYNTVRFLSLEAGDKGRDEAWSAILWGIMGLVIMFSVYGLIRFTLATFGINRASLPPGAQQYLP